MNSKRRGFPSEIYLQFLRIYAILERVRCDTDKTVLQRIFCDIELLSLDTGRYADGAVGMPKMRGD